MAKGRGQTRARDFFPNSEHLFCKTSSSCSRSQRSTCCSSVVSFIEFLVWGWGDGPGQSGMESGAKVPPPRIGNSSPGEMRSESAGSCNGLCLRLGVQVACTGTAAAPNTHT